MGTKDLIEYGCVKKKIGVFDFSLEGKVRVSGEKRIEFVNSLITNDLKKIKINEGLYAAFLDKFGKIQSDCIVYNFKDFLLLNMNIVGKNNIIEKLKEEAKLMKCTVDDVSMKWALFSLQGPKALELVNSTIDSGISLKKQYDSMIKKISLNSDDENEKDETELLITKNQRTTEEGFDIFVEGKCYNEFKKLLLEKGKSFEIKEINNETYNVLRLEAKIPLFSVDFDSKNIINEVTEKAIDYEKGCFVGQEIVARVKNLANNETPRKLVFLEIDTYSVPEKGTKIMSDGKEAGHITSAAYSLEEKKVIAFGFIVKKFYSIETFFVDGIKTTIA